VTVVPGTSRFSRREGVVVDEPDIQMRSDHGTEQAET
jgi:hypothetical protein